MSNKDVYLIHFNKKLCHAQHYIGSSHNISKRIKRHNNCKGARLLEVLHKNNIHYKLVRVWNKAEIAFERYLKNRKKSWKLCPICNSKSWFKNGVIT